MTEGKNEKAFFKKEYCCLKDDYIFAFYVELDDSARLPENMKTEVPIGQGKSLFSVEFVEQENTIGKLDLSEIIQIGGHASIGCGFTKFTKLNYN